LFTIKNMIRQIKIPKTWTIRLNGLNPNFVVSLNMIQQHQVLQVRYGIVIKNILWEELENLILIACIF